jgi:hypothetical protein
MSTFAILMKNIKQPRKDINQIAKSMVDHVINLTEEKTKQTPVKSVKKKDKSKN